MQYTVIRSDINRIQSRLFDILTVRISNKNTTLTQMYYDHQYVNDYMKALNYEKLYKVAFPVETAIELEALERKLILGKIHPRITVKLPNKGFDTTTVQPYSKIVVNICQTTL